MSNPKEYDEILKVNPDLGSAIYQYVFNLLIDFNVQNAMTDTKSTHIDDVGFFFLYDFLVHALTEKC